MPHKKTISIRTAVLISLLLHACLPLLFHISSHTLPDPPPVIIDLNLNLPSGGRIAASGHGAASPGHGPSSVPPAAMSRPAHPAARNPAPGRSGERAAPGIILPLPSALPGRESHRKTGEAILLESGTSQVAAPGSGSVLPGPVGGGSTGGGTRSGGGSGSGSGSGSGAGSGSGSGNSSERQRSRYLAEHFAYIRDIIHRRLTYPNRARREGWGGKVRVSFVILEDGNVTDIRITGSSGYEILDQSAVEAIRKAAPFPRPPIKAELRMPIDYHLEQ